MIDKKIIRIRNITLFIWLFFPIIIYLIPFINEITGTNDWVGIYFTGYLLLCFGFGYKLEKSKCPDCHEYMFRGGQLKYALKKFIFRQCGHCGYELKGESVIDS